MSGMHSFGLPAEPLKDKQLLSAFGGAQDRVAVGPMSPTIEFASSNFHLASQRLEVRDRSRWIRRTPGPVAARQAWSKTTRGNQCG